MTVIKLLRRVVFSISLIATMPLVANAGLTSYGERDSFESAFGTVVVDPLLGIKTFFNRFEQRDGYTINSQGSIGCTNFSTCVSASNTSTELDSPYLLSFTGSDTYIFDQPIYGFGVDFSTQDFDAPGSVSINGEESSHSSGFFGIVSTQALTEITLGQSNFFTAFDNVSFSYEPRSAEAAAVSVAEPGTLFMLIFGIAGLMLLRKKR